MLISRQFILQIYGILRRQVCIKRKEATEWHRIVTSNRLAEIEEEYGSGKIRRILRANCVQGNGKINRA